MTEFEPQNQRILEKNESYWDKDNVFIDELQFLYNTSASPDCTGELPARVKSIMRHWIRACFPPGWKIPSGRTWSRRAGRASRSPISSPSTSSRGLTIRSIRTTGWLAVNNENFRQSIRYGLDRVNALSVTDPEEPENLLNNTITPANFTSANGLDYTQYPALQAISDGDSFQEDLALQYKEAAVEELTAAGATFPIQMYMRYNPDTTNWDRECQVIEQQLEGLLGADYIDVVVEAGPSTNFLSTVRRAGDYGFMKCNWGADYADPQTWTDPFAEFDNSYNFMGTDPDNIIGQEPCTNKSAETQALTDQYYDLIEKAKAITTDTEARYTAFAEAEAFLIDHAFVIPYSDLERGVCGHPAERVRGAVRPLRHGAAELQVPASARRADEHDRVRRTLHPVADRPRSRPGRRGGVSPRRFGAQHPYHLF